MGGGFRIAFRHARAERVPDAAPPPALGVPERNRSGWSRVSVDIVIDLDRAQPPVPAARQRRRIRFDPRLLLAPSLLLVLLIPESAAHRPGPLAEVFTAVASPDAAPMIHNGVLYVGDGTTMTAYRLVDGRRLWRTPAGAGQTEPRFVNDATHTLIAVTDGSSGSDMVGYDTATGAQRWRMESAGAVPVPGTDRIFGYQLARLPGGSARIMVLDAGTGQPVWERSLGSGGEVVGNVADGLDAAGALAASSPPGGAPLLNAVLTGDLVEVYDRGTGRLVSQGNLVDRVPALGESTGDRYAVLVGRLLLVSSTYADGSVLDALDATSLALRWSTLLPMPLFYPNDCGGLLCIVGDGGTVTVDPATGTVIGQSVWLSARPLGAGALLVEGAATYSVAGPDLTSRLDLREWSVLASGATTVLMRPAQPPTRTWIALVDPAVPAVRIVGAVAAADIRRLVTDGRYLVCRTGSGRIAVFRLR